MSQVVNNLVLLFAVPAAAGLLLLGLHELWARRAYRRVFRLNPMFKRDH